MARTIDFTLNGVKQSVDTVFSDLSLLDYLHDVKNMTGTKFSCGQGVCRACTVAVQSSSEMPKEAIQSCSYPLSALEGSLVTTVEGIAHAGKLHPLQRAFLEHFSFQCGYCTPGFLMSGIVLLDHLKRKAEVNESEVVVLFNEFLGEHVCRCTGYSKYFQAFKEVIEQGKVGEG